MKYRLIDTPGFPVKHVSELKPGDGEVLFISDGGFIYTGIEETGWPVAQDHKHNPSGLVARAFEVVQDEWTWRMVGDPISLYTYRVYRVQEYWGEFSSRQAAIEYCSWKNGHNPQ